MIVWTVIAVGERMTKGRDPTQPLTGGPMSIFAPQQVKVDTVIECVGCYTSQEHATYAAQVHCQKNAQDRVKIKVVTLDDIEAVQKYEDPPIGACPDCGRPTVHSALCPACQKAHWLRCREQDPEVFAS